MVPCSVVQWNGSPRTTTFTSPTGLNAAISAADVASAATVPVTVFTLTDGGGGGTSNALTFTVFNQAPASAVGIVSLAQSVRATSTPAAGPSSLATPTMSADKRYAVVVLASTDGVTEIPGTPENIFVRDTCTGAPAGCAPSVALASACRRSRNQSPMQFPTCHMPPAERVTHLCRRQQNLCITPFAF